MSISFESDHVTGRALAGGGTEKQEPEEGAAVTVSPLEAEEVWPRVLEHKWYLSERVGRDVGLRAAAVDYFENVCKVTKREQVRDTLPPPTPFTRPFGHW